MPANVEKPNNKLIHPNSRKCLALIKKTNKMSNKEKKRQEAVLKQAVIAEKLLWFQRNMVEGISPYTPELTAELLQRYIARNDEELEQIHIKHSIGGRRNRQHASREDVIRNTKERETVDYKTCGIEIPDILNAVQCKLLIKWNGDLKFLPNFKFRNFGKKHLEESRKNGKKLCETFAPENKSITKNEYEGNNKDKCLENIDNENKEIHPTQEIQKDPSMDVQ